MQTVQQQSRGLWEWDIVKAVSILSVLLFISLFYYYGFNEEGNRQSIRWSARISVLLFSIAFSASALHRLFRNSFTYWIRMNRKYWGISFAIVHLIHLAFLLMLQHYFHPVFNLAKTISLIGGGLAYVFLVLMLLTSFPRFSKHLSKRNWVILHTVGGYWIWYIFMRSYVKRALTEYEYIPLAVLLAAVLVLRLTVKKS